MHYKIVAVDMDGTLLNSKGEVSEKNRKALKLATEKGIQVVLSTGRVFTSARYFAKLLGLITPIIACNGAYVCEYHRNNVLYEEPIESIDLKEVIETAEKNNMYFHFYDNKNFYANKLEKRALEFYMWNERQKTGDKINIEIVDTPLKLIEKEKIKVYKVTIVDEEKEKLDYIRGLLKDNTNIRIESSMRNNIEIMNKNVSKGRALERLCNILGIHREEVIAIGDNYNDLSMLEFAGTAVAMGNGEEEVKKAAHLITDTNDNDGVAKALEKLIF